MKEAEFFREQAKECRAAALEKARTDEARALRQLARHYEEQAAKVEAPKSRH